MLLQFIFSSLLCNDTLDIDNLNLEMYAQDQMRTTDGRKYSNRGGWQSNFLDESPELIPLVVEINNRLEALRDTIGFRDELNLQVESMWININHPYSYNSLHIHPNSYMSGVYYVKVPENSGNLELKHPTRLQSLFTPSDVLKTYNENNSSTWNILPETGKLVIFPSWIEHQVTQNLSGEDRISIAFNAAFYKKA